MGIVACYWGAIVVLALTQDWGDVESLGYLAVTTSFVAVWLLRIWMGGPMGITYMTLLLTVLGWVYTLGMVVLGRIVSTQTGLGLTQLAGLMLGALVGAGVILTGRLLARDDARRWSDSRSG